MDLNVDSSRFKCMTISVKKINYGLKAVNVSLLI